jgi:hypothetical protein
MFEIIENDLTPELIEQHSIPLISKYLVYFDPLNSSILSITNEKRDDFANFFEIDFEKVKMFLEGKKDPSQYKVFLNPSNTFEIVSKVINQDTKSTMLMTILPSKDSASLTVVHNSTLSAWKIVLSDEERNRLTNNIIDYSVNIFVTSSRNKNSLYRTLTVNLEDLIKHGEFLIPFEHRIEHEISKIMLSTMKFFESYSLTYE